MALRHWQVLDLLLFDADEFFQRAVVKSPITVTRCVNRPGFSKLSEIVESYQRVFIEVFGCPVNHLDLAAHKREEQILVDGNHVAIETPPPSRSAGTFILPNVDSTTVDGQYTVGDVLYFEVSFDKVVEVRVVSDTETNHLYQRIAQKIYSNFFTFIRYFNFTIIANIFAT